MTRAARQAAAAADALLDWLSARDAAAAGSGTLRDGTETDRIVSSAAALDKPAEMAPLHDPGPASAPSPATAVSIADGALQPTAEDPGVGDCASDALRLAHTDWLYHQLDVVGPAAAVGAFRKAATRSGVVPWHLDLDRIEEDVFLLLAAPPSPQLRSLSAAGASILAEELRVAVARRHEAALAGLGRSAACPFDLQALVPVPAEILRLGPDHPRALNWFWTHWGTTQALRHVTVMPAPPDGARAGLAPGEGRLSLRFWSADWTPWRALLALQARWPVLRWRLQPQYDAT